MARRFGTDGIRGAANEELTPELSLALGRAAASVFGTDRPFLIGRDTRVSGPMLQAALSAGLASGGAEIIDVGVLPTPGIAYLSARQDLPAAVVSASHNPFTDNGIKFFAPGAKKLSSSVEAQIEALLANPSHSQNSADVGMFVRDIAMTNLYQDHLVSLFDKERFGGSVVIDCANGAASSVAPYVMNALGVQATFINAAPDGKNINDDCGSTHPEGLQRAVVERDAALGLAFDGDADRVLAVDENGELVDGDQIIAMLALALKEQGRLYDNTVVVTVMSNLGLRNAMSKHGIAVHETPVGDRHVVEALSAHGWSLGGEQSGHIVLPEISTTGDGLLIGLCLMQLMSRSGKSLSEAASVMTRLPQVLKNVRVKDLAQLTENAAVASAVSREQQQLGDSGRVFLRASGTEPLVRVMVEAATQQEADAICDRIVKVVEEELT